MDCQSVRALFDERGSLSSDERRSLDLHIADCSDCTAENGIEGLIRDVISPAEIPSPSSGFEAALMSKLDLAPLEAPVSHPAARWAWAAGIILCGLVFTLIYQPSTFSFYKYSMYLMNKTASGMIYLDGLVNSAASALSSQSGSAIGFILGEVSRNPVLMNSLTLALMFGSFAALGGVIAVGIINRH